MDRHFENSKIGLSSQVPVFEEVKDKQIYEDMLSTLSGQHPSYAIVKNWIPSFMRVKFSIEDWKGQFLLPPY